MRRRLEPLAPIALLLAALLACKGGSKSDASKGAAAGGDKPDKTTEELPTLAVGALEMLADYKANEVRGDNKYKGKLVAVAGVVGDIKKDFTDSAYITLGRGGELELETVHCELKDGQESVAAGLSKGQKAVFKGRVTGYVMLSVMMKDCEYWAEASKPQAPAQPAQAQPQRQPAAQPQPRQPAPPPPPRKR